MRPSIRALAVACGAATILTTLAVTPAEAHTHRVPCPSSIHHQGILWRGEFPRYIDLVIYDADLVPHCYGGRSRRPVRLNFFGVTQLYKRDAVRAVDVVVQRNKEDRRNAYERYSLDSNRSWRWYLGQPAYRLESIHIR